MRSTSCGLVAPTVSFWPTSTCSPSLTRRRARFEIGNAVSSLPSSGVTTSFLVFSVSSIRTRPWASEIGATPLGVPAGLDVVGLAQDTVRAALRDVQLEAAVGAAVLLADDDVLGDVDQTTGEVTRVGGTEGGVGQTLTSTVSRDEVLQHRQAL